MSSEDPDPNDPADATSLPTDLAERAGLRAARARSDEYLHQRPEEVLARLARVTRLCAITNALVFPEHPGLRARWDRTLERWVSSTSSKPADCIAIRDGRAIHLHRSGDVEPTSVIALRKPEDVISALLLLEELDRFRTLASVRIATNDIDSLGALVDRLSELLADEQPGVTRLRVLPSAVVQDASGEAAPETPPLPSPSEETTRVERPAEPPPEAQPLPGVALGWRARVMRVLDLEGRDLGSVFWLTCFGAVSFGTTWHGAAQLGLPEELAFVATAGVTGFLWTLLVGMAMAHDKVRKLSSELVFAAACVYCSFFTYYEGMTEGRRGAESADRVQSAHEQLLGTVYRPHAAELEALRQQGAELDALVDRERNLGSTTGHKGYGPKAREYAEQAARVRVQAATLSGQVATLEEVASTPIDGLSADAVHLLDLSIWSSAPVAWREGVPRPDRELYVGEEASRASLLLPIEALQRGEPDGYAAMLVAVVVDGMMLWCGSAISTRRERRERLIKRATLAATRLHREASDAVASARASRQIPGRDRYLYRDDE